MLYIGDTAITGSTASGGNFTIHSTAHATKGTVFIEGLLENATAAIRASRVGTSTQYIEISGGDASGPLITVSSATAGNKPLRINVQTSDGGVQSNNCIIFQADGTETMRFDTNSNICVGVTGVGTSGTKVLGLGSGTAPSSAPADMVQLYSVDVSAGNCVLGIYQEMAPYAGVAVASTTKIPLKVNGTTYYVLATTVA